VQQLLISDANILIDMEEGLLLDKMFNLPFQFAIPDILFVEELEEEHAHLPEIGLKIEELSSESMMYAMEIIPLYPKASRNDCFALSLAKQEKCTLLTGDKALKNAANKEAVLVKGTLWLVDQLIRQGLISTADARIAYEQMKATGRRLPWHIAEEMLKEIEAE